MKDEKWYLIPGTDSAIGNLSENIFYAHLKAERKKNKFFLVRKRIPFYFILTTKLSYRQPKALYEIKSEKIEKNNVFAMLFSLFLGLFVFLSYSITVVKYFLIKKFNKISTFFKIKNTFHPYVPTIGTTDLFNLNMSNTFEYNNRDRLYWNNALKKKFVIEFPKHKEQFSKEVFNKLDLDKYPWYVCLHIRTPHYYNSNHNSFRNSNIENYYDAIEYITKLGGAVVRLGDPISDVKDIDGFINYPNSEFKSEIVDLYLIKNCKFYLGTNSGIYDTAVLFGVPILAVNVTDYLYLQPFKDCDTFIYKHVYSKKLSRILSFKEVFQEPFYVNSNTVPEFSNYYKLIENTSVEILSAVQNFMHNLDNKCNQRTEKQMNFKEDKENAILKWIYEEKYFKDDIDQAYRVFSKLNYNGSIDKDFIEKYY